MINDYPANDPNVAKTETAYWLDRRDCDILMSAVELLVASLTIDLSKVTSNQSIAAIAHERDQAQRLYLRLINATNAVADQFGTDADICIFKDRMSI